jgi:DNA-binding response OmpR family regulator
MPGKDGYALIKAVKGDAYLRTIPFAFISSTVWADSDRQTGLGLGAVKFIMRPIAPLALLAAVEDSLRQSGSSGAQGETR